MLTNEDLQLAQSLIQRGLVTQEQIAGAINTLKEAPDARSLLGYLAEKGFITPAQAEMLRPSGPPAPAPPPVPRSISDAELAKLVVNNVVALPHEVEECQRDIEAAKASGVTPVPRLGQLLLSKGYVSEAELNRLLATAAPATRVAGKPTPRPAGAPGVPPAARIAGKPTPRPAAGAPAQRPAGSSPTPRPSSGAAAGAPPAPRTNAHPTPSGEIRCHFCGFLVPQGDPRHVCEFCTGVYHDECWAKTGGCVESECQVSKRVKARTGAGRVLATYRFSIINLFGSLVTRIVTAALVLVVGSFLYYRFSHDAEYYYNKAKALSNRPVQDDKGRAWRAVDIHRGLLAGEGGGKIANVEKEVNLEEQIECLRTAVDKKPDFLDAWFDLGLAYLALGRAKESFEAMQKVLALKHDHAEAMTTIGTACESMNDLTGAEEWYKKAIAAKPDLPQAHQLLATLYDRKLHAPEKALAEYRIVFGSKKDDTEIASRLADLLLDQKQYDEAMSVLVDSGGLGQTAPEIKREVARLYCLQGKWKEALEAVEPVVRANGEDWVSRRVQAICLDKLNRGEEAYVVAKEMARGVNDPEILAMAGRLAIRYGEGQQGIQWLRQAFTAGHDPAVLELVGDAELALGSPEEAKSAYEELRSLAPSTPNINFKVALATASDKDRTRALKSLRELLAQKPKDPDLRALEAKLLREGGDLAGSTEELQGILAEGGKTAFVWLQLGISQREGGNPAAALSAFRSANAVGACPDADFEVGMTYAALGNAAAARKALAKYVDEVSFGKNYDKARSILDPSKSIGGPAADPTLATTVDQCRDLVMKLGAGGFVDSDPADAVSASIGGVDALSGLVVGDSLSAQQGLGSFYSGTALLQQPTQTYGQMDPAYLAQQKEAVLTGKAGMWVQDLVRAAGVNAAYVRKKDTAKKCADELSALSDEQRACGGAVGPDKQLAAAARAYASSVKLLVDVVAEGTAARAQAERISNERKMQAEYATNGLEEACGELYAAVKFANLLAGVRDGRGGTEKLRAEALKRFDQRELGAKCVLDQLSNAGIALCDILWMIASDPSMRL